MRFKDTMLYHNLAGNDAPPRSVGFTRGTVAAALAGIVNGILLCIPVDETLKVSIMASLSPTITLVSFFAFGILDHKLGKYIKDED